MGQKSKKVVRSVRRQTLEGHCRFVLLDANVVAGYYLPESLDWKRARPRIKELIESVRAGASPEVFLYIPSICIAEVFAVFNKYTHATWDGRVNKRLPGLLHGNRCRTIKRQFSEDIHNGRLMQQVELNRYHVLATDLISPIDARYAFSRRTKKNPDPRRRMMAAADHLVIGMAIQLARVHGWTNFAVITADQRLANIVQRAATVRKTQAKELGVIDAADRLGIEFDPKLYPRVVHLGTASKAELADFFGEWPPPAKPPTKRRTNALRPSDVKLLSKLRRLKRMGRDQLPYTQAFEDICTDLERQTGRKVDRHLAWVELSNYEKVKQKQRRPA